MIKEIFKLNLAKTLKKKKSIVPQVPFWPLKGQLSFTPNR